MSFPAWRALAKDLAALAPAIPVAGAHIRLLDSPTSFYRALIDVVQTARSRIVIGALYLGTAPGLESEFLDCLAEAASAQTRTGVRITMVYDALRATRPSLNRDGQQSSTSRETAERVLRHQLSGAPGGGGATLALYRTPSLRGLLDKLLPPRVREVVGVNHVKAFVFDDTVIMTGANLSNSYFTTRRDRYMLFRASPQLADFVSDFMSNVLTDASFRVRPDGALEPLPPSGLHPVRSPDGFNAALQTGLKEHFRPLSQQAWDDMLLSFPATSRFRDACEPSSSTPTGSASSAETAASHDTSPRPVPSARVAASTSAGRTDASQSNGRQDAAPAVAAVNDTLVFPTVQAYSAGVRQDEKATLAVLANLRRGDCLHMSSAYLNLVPQYEKMLMRAAGADLHFITSSPRANGFYGAAGLSGAIPEAYAILARQTLHRISGRRPRHPHGRAPQPHPLPSVWRLLRSTVARSVRSKDHHGAAEGDQPQATLHEYVEPGWEFHSKGLWLRPAGDDAPALTTIGSPNFGYRSVYRDLELQMFVVTENAALRSALRREVDGILAHCAPVSLQPRERPPWLQRVSARLAAHWCRSYF